MLAAQAAVLLGVFYVTYLVLRYFLQLFQHRRHSKALHCQPPPAGSSLFFGIPAFLRLSRAVREKRWIEYIAEQYNIVGNTFSQRIFTRDLISTREPENIKAILATQFKDFCLGNRHQEFFPLLGNGIFTMDGAGWSHARALLRPQFVRDQVGDLPLFDDHIRHLIDLIPKDGSRFDIQRLFFLLTIDSATHFLFGESIGTMASGLGSDGVMKKLSVGSAAGFAKAFDTSQDYLAARSRAQNLYWLVDSKEFREANRQVHEVVDHYVNLALEAKRHPGKRQNDSRYIFSDALVDQIEDPRALRDHIMNILLAGRDTTASLLSSTFFFLSRHPDVFNKLRRTIIDQLGDSQNPREITHAELKDISYLRHVLNEVLRLMPPVPVNFRVAARDTSLPVGGGSDGSAPVYVKKGTIVAYSVYAMHRRTDLYGLDAHVFRPERWEEDTRRGWDFLPFNGGPRICLGQQYALTETGYTVVRMLQHFDTLENADTEVGNDPIKHSTLTMSHEMGVHVRLYSSRT